MVLSSLCVKELHGSYNYKVDFNDDVTLLYGTNGCGKTTILNIITAIITGNLYKLFSYTFKEISLEYYNEQEKEKAQKIIVLKDNESVLNVFFKGEEKSIEKLQISEDSRRGKESIEMLYVKTYPLLREIKGEFNYVYLALNRASSLSDDDGYLYLNRTRYYIEDEFGIIEPEKIDPEIRYIENLVARRYMMATSQINKINNEFRDSILKSALDVNVQTDIDKVLADFDVKKHRGKDISKIKDSYLRILSEFELASSAEKKRLSIFFESYSNRIKALGNDINGENLFSLFMQYNEMKKIQGIVDIAAEAEERKAKVMRPIELFLEVVNDFISTSDMKKEIGININGRVYFTTRDQKQNLSVQFLSSGERQLLIFFANLIFGVKDTSSGIFVVDEPELSLHLSWQKVFVKKALEIGKSVQFIFATHSPEIVANYRNKTKKLQRLM